MSYTLTNEFRSPKIGNNALPVLKLKQSKISAFIHIMIWLLATIGLLVVAIPWFIKLFSIASTIVIIKLSIDFIRGDFYIIFDSSGITWGCGKKIYNKLLYHDIALIKIDVRESKSIRCEFKAEEKSVCIDSRWLIFRDPIIDYFIHNVAEQNINMLFKCHRLESLGIKKSISDLNLKLIK